MAICFGFYSLAKYIVRVSFVRMFKTEYKLALTPITQNILMAPCLTGIIWKLDNQMAVGPQIYMRATSLVLECKLVQTLIVFIKTLHEVLGVWVKNNHYEKNELEATKTAPYLSEISQIYKPTSSLVHEFIHIKKIIIRINNLILVFALSL